MHAISVRPFKKLYILLLDLYVLKKYYCFLKKKKKNIYIYKDIYPILVVYIRISILITPCYYYKNYVIL